MADTGARTLRLLSLLQDHRDWRGDDLAARLEVSARTLRRDVERLRLLGYPVESGRGTDGGYRLAAGSVLPPLVLDDEEAVALVLALHGAAHTGAAGVAESAVRALGKVMQMLPQRLRRDAEALRSMTVTGGWSPPPADTAAPATLSVLAQACRDTVRVRFGYTARDGAVTDRFVEPYRLVHLGHRWYLLAFDVDRHDWRTFRADRLRDPQPARNSFTARPLPAADVVAYVRARLDDLAAVHDVEVVVHAPAATVRDIVGRWGEVETLADDRCRLRMRADSLDWVVLVLGGIEADFDVVRPDELVDHLRSCARRFRRAALVHDREGRA